MSEYDVPVNVQRKHKHKHRELVDNEQGNFNNSPSKKRKSVQIVESPIKKSKRKKLKHSHETKIVKAEVEEQEIISLEDGEEGDETKNNLDSEDEFEISELSLEKIEKEIDYDDLWKNSELPRQKNPNTLIDDSLVSSHPIHQLLPRLTNMKRRDEMEILTQHGLSVQYGRFTKVENALLKRSWHQYLQDYIVPIPQLMFGNFMYNNNANRSLKLYYHGFVIRTKLMLRLAKDLPNRTLSQIYLRSRVLLSGLKQARDFTDEDRETILSLRRIHGDQYSKFCENYGYNPRHAREVVRNNVKPNGASLKHGQWTNEEINKLRANVFKVMKKEKIESYDNIPWSKVAADINRSDAQCRQRFFSKTVFMLVQTKQDINQWDEKFDMARLIALLKRCNWSDEPLIDWDFIKDQFSM